MFRLLIASLFLSTTASAYTPRELSGCSSIAFASNPEVLLHTGEASGFNFVTGLQALDTMTDVHATFDNLGGSSARVTALNLTSDPFVFRNWFNDPTPTIHVGFTSDPSAAPGTTFWDVDANCNIVEAHILLKNPSAFNWAMGMPGVYGLDYWMEGLTNSTGRYLRIAYVHELLHAFGLAHSNDGYAMLNYGDRPFANRDESEQIQPLPDDLQGLRFLYPDASARADVAVLNTWFETDTASTAAYPAADQFQLCSPSTGSWSPDIYDDTCGVTPLGANGSTTVCPGDDLRTRFTVANFSTDDVDLEVRLWLSTDPILDYAAGGDKKSPDGYSTSIGGSGRRGYTFEVPGGLQYNTEYYVIAKVRGETVGGDAVSDWSPLRGTVRTARLADCLTLVPVLP